MAELQPTVTQRNNKQLTNYSLYKSQYSPRVSRNPHGLWNAEKSLPCSQQRTLQSVCVRARACVCVRVWVRARAQTNTILKQKKKSHF